MEMKRREETKSKPVTGDAAAPISVDDSRTLNDEFKRRHAYTLGSFRLLSDILQGRLLREYGSDPKSFQVIVPDKLLMRNSISVPTGTQLTFMDGQLPKKEEIVNEDVENVIELWERIRALCNTLAFISVQRPNWFSFEQADEFADKLLCWMNKRYDSKRSPLQFFVQAYVSTFQLFK